MILVPIPLAQRPRLAAAGRDLRAMMSTMLDTFGPDAAPAVFGRMLERLADVEIVAAYLAIQAAEAEEAA